MKIQALLESKARGVHKITPDATIGDAIASMVDRNIGSLMVVDAGGDIVGIVTERDCLREVAGNPAFRAQSVETITTRDIAIAELDDDLAHVMDTMVAKQCRHVPILDGGSLVGMISIRDVVGERLRETRTELKFLRDYISGHAGPG